MQDQDAPLEIAAGFVPVDFESAAWLRMVKYLEARRAQLRAENDGDLPLDRTAKQRGRIQEINDLLELPARVAQWQHADHRDS